MELTAPRRPGRPASPGWRTALAALLLVGAGAVPALATDESELIAAGQRIYREGVLPDGQLVRSEAQLGMSRNGSAAACMTCHRRSGFGMTEGNVAIRPITAQALFQSAQPSAATPRQEHQLGVQLRPPYDDEKLARAIREGVDASGQPLSPSMPRFALSDDQLKALGAYLRTLSAQAEPGVSADTIHLATVIQPGVTAARQKAMLDVLAAFIRDKNAATRSDVERRQAGTMRMQRAYRQWQHHVWQLVGPAESWGAQLETFYRNQPVFALVSGLGDQAWQPVQDFSERFQVPCVFPQTLLPPGNAEQNFYTLYLSRGIALEADILAQYLGTQREGKKLIQVFRPQGAGKIAAQAFRARLPRASQRLTDHVLEGAADAGFWQALAKEDGAAELILWLDAGDLENAASLLDTARARPLVHLSATLIGGISAASRLASAGATTLLVYPWDSPETRAAAQKRTSLWLRRKGLAPTDDAVQVDTFFTVNIVGDVLSHILDNFSRDYFVERVEHATQQSLLKSSFPQVSLAPQQRFAGKGSFVVRLDPDPARGFTALSPWIVPESGSDAP